jgi:hypothetical protein
MEDGNVVRYDPAKPEDLAALVANGLVWSLAPEVRGAAMEALLDGTIPMNDKVPDDVRVFIEAQTNPMPGE